MSIGLNSRYWPSAKYFLFVVLVTGPVFAPRAQAFHVGATYDAAAGAGGGGGIFYIGAPRDRGWTCAHCHVDAPRRLRVAIEASDGLLDTGRYTPQREYQIRVRILNEALGLASTRSNYNSVSATVADRAGVPVGAFVNYDPTKFYARGRAILASSSTTVGETEWTFSWTAPSAGTGPVTLYVAVVDGNGADSTATETLTDPFGDDIAEGVFQLAEDAPSASLLPRASPSSSMSAGRAARGRVVRNLSQRANHRQSPVRAPVRLEVGALTLLWVRPPRRTQVDLGLIHT